jgi:Domain of unknown function (DUF4105)
VTKLPSLIGRVFLAIVVAAMTVWGTLALSYRLSPDGVLRGFIFAFWLATFLAALWGLLRRRWLALLPYSLALVALFVWWSGIEPRNDRDWAPDVARTLTGTIDGHSVHLTNVRNLDWRSDSDFTERWVERTYDLDQLDSLDLINSYWSGPVIAHTLLSFGFSDGRHLVFSIEIRRKRGDVYSVLSGFFKQNELTINGADEREIIRIGSNIRGEDVSFSACRRLRNERATCSRSWWSKPMISLPGPAFTTPSPRIARRCSTASPAISTQPCRSTGASSSVAICPITPIKTACSTATCCSPSFASAAA